jgi:hypothetical protein
VSSAVRLTIRRGCGDDAAGTQAFSAQAWSTGHAVAHAPQWAASFEVSMHSAPQNIQPPPVQPTWQVPSVHVSPVEQAFPHVPQFVTSDVVSTQYVDEPVPQV